MAPLGRDTTVTGPFPRGALLLETLAGSEELGRPFQFQLGLLSTVPDIDPKDVLGKPLAVGIKLGTGAWRHFHGVVTEFAKAGMKHRYMRYQARLNPMLSQLAHTSDCRIFNEAAQHAVGIVTEVLAERGLSDLASGSIADHAYRAREYCVQYGESDLHFVQRLLEEEGIYYFFRHEEGKHTMVLADSIAGHVTADGYESVPHTSKERRVAGTAEYFWEMTVREALYPGQHTVLSGYDPTKLRPGRPCFGEKTSTEPAPGATFEHYAAPGGLYPREEAAKEAMLRSQAAHVTKTVVEVEGNTLGLGVGHLVTVRPGLGLDVAAPFWSAEGFGKQYLVVRATYSVSIDQYETGKVAGSDEPFRARYCLLDSKTPYRPRRTTSKVRMGGPQTALVVGPVGEEIWTDSLGRVKVLFDWDRERQRKVDTSCWVRVGQMWGGSGFGGQHISRVGQEVLVRFLDGDPDRPIIAGTLYNADDMPPYDLPGNQTQSGVKSRSSKEGGVDNFNEIRLEDQKGAEELHTQAEKDMSTLVKHCQALEVGVDRRVEVGNDEDNLVKLNRALAVKVDDSVMIGGAHDKTVIGRVTQIYGGGHRRTVRGDQELVAEQSKKEHVKQAHVLTTDKKFQLVQDATSMTFNNKNVTLSAGGEIVLTAGGATVSMEKSGMTTFSSPAGISLVWGSSSSAVTPAGIAIASPAVTAAAGGSQMSLGSDEAAVSSRQVIIEAEGVCSVWGRKALQLQESEKKKGKGGDGGEGEGAASADQAPVAYDEQLRFIDQSTGEPLAGMPYVILRDGRLLARGRTDNQGMTVRVGSRNSEAELTVLWGDDALAWS